MWVQGMMEGSYEKAFPDIIKFVETHYRTINNKANRAIAGLSMGDSIQFKFRQTIRTNSIMLVRSQLS